MKNKVLAKIIILIGIILLLASGYLLYASTIAIEDRKQSIHEIDTYLANHVATPFENNSLAKGTPQTAVQSEALYSYQATETLTFLSHSEHWDEAKLKALYEELLKNKHGAEIETLHEVIVWPQEDETTLATHSSDVVEQSLEFNFGALPNDFHLDFTRNVSLIALYGGDKETTVEDMAWSLSHEYGHLYTFYNMFKGHTNDLADTEYGKLRECVENNLESAATPGDNYIEDHYKHLFEVAAEDYVQLMGSPTTRQVINFKDVQQLLDNKDDAPEKRRFSGNNGGPQENLEIPLASEVDGLAEYFYQFIDENAPAPAEERKTIDISIEPVSNGYDLTDGYREFVHFNLTWNTPYTDAIYTMVCYDADSYKILPIKTVHVGETAIATIGTVVKNNGTYINYLSDEFAQGAKTFVVIAQLPDGTYYSSEPLEHTF